MSNQLQHTCGDMEENIPSFRFTKKKTCHNFFPFRAMHRSRNNILASMIWGVLCWPTTLGIDKTKQVATVASSSTTTAGCGEQDGINLFPHVSNLCLACCKVCSCSDTGGVVA
jgi:hypothetical protein